MNHDPIIINWSLYSYTENVLQQNIDENKKDSFCHCQYNCQYNLLKNKCAKFIYQQVFDMHETGNFKTGNLSHNENLLQFSLVLLRKKTHTKIDQVRMSSGIRL